MSIKAIIGMEHKEIFNPSVRDINKAIDNLDPENQNPFIVLEVSKRNNEFIQVLHYKDHSDDTNKYRVEFRCGTFHDYKHYKLLLADKNEIKKMFEKALLNQEFPSQDNWEDITTEMKNHNKTHTTLSIIEIAKISHRDEKTIIDCYGFKHGSALKDAVVYQFIAESIILCKSVLINNNSFGGIYYTEDKKKFYIDIIFPPEWVQYISKVYSIRGLLTDKMIQISSYSRDNSFIEANVKPIGEYEKLLTCILLLFIKFMLTDDNYILQILNFFRTSSKELFEDIYSKFLVFLENSEYYIGYEDGGDFNFSRYLPLSDLYNNFVENCKINDKNENTRFNYKI